jgi:hypothetical protein
MLLSKLFSKSTVFQKYPIPSKPLYMEKPAGAVAKT